MRIQLVLLPLAFATLLPAQQSPTMLRGRLTDQDGAPLQGVGVTYGPKFRITTRDALDHPLARSGADGRFELKVANPIDRLADQRLVIAAPGRATMSGAIFGQYGWRRVAAVVDIGELVLGPGVRVEGRVRDQRGRPIAGAIARAIDLLAPNRHAGLTYSARALSDSKGRFVFTGTCATALRVVVDAPGHYRTTIPFMNADDPLVIAPKKSGFIAGRLIAKRAGPGPFHACITYELGNVGSEWVKTDAAGSFKTTLRAPCGYVVVGVNGGGQAFGQSTWLRGPKRGIQVRAARDLISIRTKDAKSGADLRVFRGLLEWDPKSDEGFLTMLFGAGAESADAAGTLRCLRPDSASATPGKLRVVAPGYAPHFDGAIQPKKSGPTEIVVALGRGSTASGVVVSATGERIANAEIQLFPSPHYTDSAWSLAVAAGRSDGRGRFQLGGLAKGKYLLVARQAGTLAESDMEFEIGADQERKDLRVPIQPPLTISGRVQNLDANARACVVAARDQVLLYTGVRRWFGFPGATPSNVPGVQRPGADGAFEIAGLSPGGFDLFLMLPVPPRTGSPLQIPLRTIRLRDASTRVEFDAQAHRPAVAHGKLRIKGATVPRGRLAIVFTRTPDVTHWVDRDVELARSRWIAPDRSGDYKIALAPGKHRMTVVDLATGVRVLVRPGLLEVGAGEKLKLDLSPTIVRAEVSLRPKGKSMHVDFLRVTLPDQKAELGNAAPSTLLGVTGSGYAQVDLTQGARRVALFVPPGTVRLAAMPGYRRVHGLSTDSGRGDIGTAEFQATGAKCTVRIDVAPPAGGGSR